MTRPDDDETQPEWPETPAQRPATPLAGPSVPPAEAGTPTSPDVLAPAPPPGWTPPAAAPAQWTPPAATPPAGPNQWAPPPSGPTQWGPPQVGPTPWMPPPGAPPLGALPPGGSPPVGGPYPVGGPPPLGGPTIPPYGQGWPPGSNVPPGPGWPPSPGAPPVVPGAYYWTPQAPYPPRPDQRRRVTVGIVVGVVLAVALGVVLLAALISAASALAPLVGRTQLADLDVGQCFNGARAAGTSTEVLFAVEVVPCSESHESELAATFDYPPTDTYPGERAVSLYAEDECARRFRSYVGVSYELSQLEMTTIYPLEFNWYTGDESIQCVVHPPPGQQTSTGSYRNYGR